MTVFYLWTILIASVVGLINASVFTGIMLGWVGVRSPFVQRVCRLDEGDCTKVVTSPRARIFGVPNSVLGVLWYILAGGGALWALITGTLPLGGFLLAVSAFTVALGGYLTWSLIFRLKVHCKFCYLGHFMNLVIFIGLLIVHWGGY